MHSLSASALSRVKKFAWGVIAAGSCLSLWAVWLAVHLKENPAGKASMMRFLLVGVLLYMVGRMTLISLRWGERKQRRDV